MNIVITGSTRGLGLAMAKEFLKYGCNVTITGRGQNLLDSIVEELKEYNGKFHYIPCNVQSQNDLERLWNESLKKWGTIDHWINNAGQNSPHEDSYNINESYINQIIDTNIKGVIFGSLVATRGMLKEGKGQIWNVEGLGSNNMIQVKTILYGTTKHAITYFTKGLAKELMNTNVKVGRLSPGMMQTDFIMKTPDGNESLVTHDKSFQFIFNTLGDKPETVASFLVKGMLNNNKNNSHIVWLTNAKIMKRFLIAPFSKRKMI